MRTRVGCSIRLKTTRVARELAKGGQASSGRRHLLRDLQSCCGAVLPLQELVRDKRWKGLTVLGLVSDSVPFFGAFSWRLSFTVWS